jgi:DNA gyrase inhibitor GyrI
MLKRWDICVPVPSSKRSGSPDPLIQFKILPGGWSDQ